MTLQKMALTSKILLKGSYAIFFDRIEFKMLFGVEMPAFLKILLRASRPYIHPFIFRPFFEPPVRVGV